MCFLSAAPLLSKQTCAQTVPTPQHNRPKLSHAISVLTRRTSRAAPHYNRRTVMISFHALGRMSATSSGDCAAVLVSMLLIAHSFNTRSNGTNKDVLGYILPRHRVARNHDRDWLEVDETSQKVHRQDWSRDCCQLPGPSKQE